VSARLRLEVRHGPVVPESVVQAGPDGPYAFVIRPDTSVEVRPLRVAATFDGQALIDDGVAAGDRVVVDGQYKLRPGARIVTASEPKPAPAGPEKTAAVRPGALAQ